MIGKRIYWLMAAGVVLLGAERVDAHGGRFYSGGHPYHNGFHFVPPASAYEPVWIRPPFRYGVPANYFPASYLSPDTGYYPPQPYPGIPTWRSGFYYMSVHGAGTWYPW